MRSQIEQLTLGVNDLKREADQIQQSPNVKSEIDADKQPDYAAIVKQLQQEIASCRSKLEKAQRKNKNKFSVEAY